MNAGEGARPDSAWSRLREALALRAPAGLRKDVLFLSALVVAPPLALALAFFFEPMVLPSGGALAWRSLRVVCLEPLVEELLFRGLVQGALLRGPLGRARRVGFTAANGGTALLFSAAHLLHHPPAWSALVLFPALVFGFFRDRYGSVVPPVLLHAFYNACWLFL